MEPRGPAHEGSGGTGGGGELKRTPLKPGKPLTRGLARKTGMPRPTSYLRRTGQLPAVGKKAARDKRELDAIRPHVALRSENRCEARLAGCTGTAEHVHHILRRSQGGTNDLANLLHCCFSCHQTIHRSVTRSEEMGFLRRTTSVPGPVQQAPEPPLRSRKPTPSPRSSARPWDRTEDAA